MNGETVKFFTDFCYPTEVEDVVKLFYDIEKAVDPTEAAFTSINSIVCGKFVSKAEFCGQTDIQSIVLTQDGLQDIRLQKRCAKMSAYNVIKAATGQSRPWGCLTGIRPTKLAYQLLEEQGSFDGGFLKFDVTLQKISLVEEILQQQRGLRNFSNTAADLYIAVPFCLSRCSFCSFTSGEIAGLKNFIEPYVNALCSDIKETLVFAKENGYFINNVYIGGGTPTALVTADLKKILNCVGSVNGEFTVEAGRPDTITVEKLQLLSACGVSRISINPQTFNDRILEAVGRRHTADEVYQKYNLARQFAFDINMDLIAGLPNETYGEFCHSVNCAAGLAPENITIHTLAFKKGSILKQNADADSKNFIDSEATVADMVDYGRNKLRQNDYFPYYLYRQKYMRQNLENVGYCKSGKACLYNIGNMEELTSIFACGAGAISKRVFSGQNRIERSANAKDVKTYIENIQGFVDKKKKLFTLN